LSPPLVLPRGKGTLNRMREGPTGPHPKDQDHKTPGPSIQRYRQKRAGERCQIDENTTTWGKGVPRKLFQKRQGVCATGKRTSKANCEKHMGWFWKKEKKNSGANVRLRGLIQNSRNRNLGGTTALMFPPRCMVRKKHGTDVKIKKFRRPVRG